MALCVLLLNDSPVKLWELSSKERLHRQTREMGGVEWVDKISSLPEEGMVLLLDGNYLFEIRTFKKLMERPDSILHCSSNGRPAAAYVSAHYAKEAAAYMSSLDSRTLPAAAERLEISDLPAFDQKLRFARPPLLEHINGERQEELENILYGNSYRGITDLVTKFVWPKPARHVVHYCARIGATPNMVTSIGFVLMLAACYLFYNGYYLTGLLAGWIMTFLDTVDGKLARVTIQSTRFGDLYDHGIDLFHPPFWYVYWGLSLAGMQAVLGFDLNQLCWIVVIAYVAGRMIEGVFPFLGGPNVWTWKPFDAWFRLIVSRRNPCVIILTISVLIGRPDWGFIGVVAWMVISTVILFVRLLQGVLARLTHGPLTSWLSVDNIADGPHALSFRVFGGTRGAYKG
jgi:phosphatidylglycerophosphate synthase